MNKLKKSKPFGLRNSMSSGFEICISTSNLLCHPYPVSIIDWCRDLKVQLVFPIYRPNAMANIGMFMVLLNAFISNF